jgi:FixJ family two-component response regulator
MTDQRMPQITGIEFLSRMRTKYPNAIRMLFTGYVDLDALIAAINQGHVYRFIRKPWQPEELETAVRDAAAEYDRLVKEADLIERLLAEVKNLQERVTALEQEVARLRGGAV